MFKSQWKQVFSNDYMAFSACFRKALIENNTKILSKEEVYQLCDVSINLTFKDLYFNDEDNAFIDTVRANLLQIDDGFKKFLHYPPWSEHA